MKPIQIIFLSLLLFGFFSCQQSSSTKNESTTTEITTAEDSENPNNPLAVFANMKIDPPLSTLTIPFNQFSINSNKAKTLKLENGTSIEIPKHAFVDKDGNQILGEVKIEYREFHNALEIISSGIPTRVIQGDKVEWMQTAGMFEIKGIDQQNQEVFIAKDKTINVNMASEVDGAYPFWYFDTETSNWVEQGVVSPKVNSTFTKSEQAKKQVKQTKKPLPPAAYDKAQPSFDVVVNYKEFPELKQYQGIFWQYAGTDGKDSPKNNSWIQREKWKNINLEKHGKKYILVLESKKKTFSMPVNPCLKGKSYDLAMGNYKEELKKYHDSKADIKTGISKFTRTFAIANMGIYNHDIFVGRKDVIPLMASFDFGLISEEDLKKSTVFLITGNRKAVIQFPYYQWKTFKFDPKSENCLMIPMAGNKVATFSNKDFKEASQELQSAEGKEYIFKLKVSDKPIESIKALQEELFEI